MTPEQQQALARIERRHSLELATKAVTAHLTYLRAAIEAALPDFTEAHGTHDGEEQGPGMDLYRTVARGPQILHDLAETLRMMQELAAAAQGSNLPNNSTSSASNRPTS